ncbi:MAG TPA: hypothetical protein DCS97_12985, partial [Planctomycetes bacterium]|nr:hypothetical protein [Planctomycetota bacterium]
LDASKTTGETLRRTGTKHQRLLAQSQRMQKQLRRLSRQVMTERENDRRMISHDLYAVISQALIGINLRLEHLRREAAANPGDLDSNVRSTQLMLGSSIDIVRQYSHEMGPTVLDELGLIPALEILAGRIEKKTRISLGLELSTEVEMLPLDKRLVLYRIAEEALTHASTRPAVDRIGLSIRRGTGCIRMTVRDNGRVASPTRPSRRQRSESVEIMGMKERLAMVGGVLRVTSRPTTGTTLVVRVPCG